MIFSNKMWLRHLIASTSNLLSCSLSIASLCSSNETFVLQIMLCTRCQAFCRTSPITQLGFISYLYRLINPVVVAPTIAAVGLSFYSYGFPLVGTCLEIGVAQILLVIIFSLVSLLDYTWVYSITGFFSCILGISFHFNLVILKIL